jgi:alginate O-acetyltransferase complex protein AlgI
MLFSSSIFLLIFLPLTLLVYYLQYRFAGNRFRNPVLLAFSYVFYFFGGTWFLLILVLSTAADYVLGLKMESSPERKRHWLILSVVINIGVLAVFKYANFFVAETNAALSSLGYAPVRWTELALPLGISFFTFQKLSYTVDVYRGTRRAVKSAVDFALYVAMFPQLVAGPIVRFNEISEQLRGRVESVELFSKGAMRFCWGLSKKLMVADYCAVVADSVFALDSSSLDTRVAWIGALAYTLRIYFDFSGYSDMAIGLGNMFGFHFPENFNRPYSAVSITDFWRRWHMTLSRWFGDYLYYPLGGNRRGVGRTYFNLLVVFTLCGLWHGANWTFIVWGLYHGAFLVIERASGWRDRHGEGWTWPKRAVTAIIVITGWVIFNSATLGQAAEFIRAMYVPTITHVPFEVAYALNPRNITIMALASVAFFLPRDVTFRKMFIDARPVRVAFASAVLILVLLPYCISIIASEAYNPFIYFRF